MVSLECIIRQSQCRQSLVQLQVQTLSPLSRLATLPGGHPRLRHAVHVAHQPAHQGQHVLAQVNDHPDRHWVPTVGVDIAHIDHLHTAAVLLPQLDLLFVVEEVAEVLHLLHQDRVGIGHVEGGVDDGPVLLAELLDIGVFAFGQFLDVLLPDDGHGEGDGQFIDNGDLDDQFVLEVDEKGVEEVGKDLLPGYQLSRLIPTAKAKMAKRQLSLPEGYSFTMFADSTSTSPSYSEKFLPRKGSSISLYSLTTARFCSLPLRCTRISSRKTATAATVKAWYHRYSSIRAKGEAMVKRLQLTIQMQRPDHPHQAAVHLMKALRCCEDCYSVSEVDVMEIRELEYRKELLAEELRAMNCKADSVVQLQEEVRELEGLVLELRSENEQAQRQGIEEIDRMSSDRLQFENQQRDGILIQLTAQRNLTHQLNLELQSLLDRIKYLNRVNNELIYNFCTP